MRLVIDVTILSIILLSIEKSESTHPERERERFFEGDSLRFFVIGDWGGKKENPYVTDPQRICANFMDHASEKLKPHFFVSTGDNFYPAGVESEHSDRFKNTFDNVFLWGKKKTQSGGNHVHDQTGKLEHHPVLQKLPVHSPLPQKHPASPLARKPQPHTSGRNSHQKSSAVPHQVHKAPARIHKDNQVHGQLEIHQHEDQTTKEDSGIIEWYLVAGNHDYYGNIDAQLKYSDLNPRWVFPWYFHSVTYHHKDHPEDIWLEIIFIDTIILCGNTWNSSVDRIDPETGKKGMRTDMPIGPKNDSIVEDSWKWIEKKLKESRAKYLFVVGHYPIFAFNEYGVSDYLVPRLHELLGNYNATGYICGHEHSLQHMTSVSSSGHKIQHILSGAGHLIRPNYFNLSSIIGENLWKLQSHLFFPTMHDVHMKWTNGLHMGGVVYIDLKAKSGTVVYYQCENGRNLHEIQLIPRH